MRRMIGLLALALAVGCAKPPPRPAPPPPEPVAAPDPFFVHTVQHDGETLGDIARWYTGKYGNWLILTKPVNPDLEKCCVALRAGREVNIPKHLVIRTDPMPPPKKKEVAKAQKASKKAPPPEEAPPPKVIGEAPSSDESAEEEESPPPAAPIAEAPIIQEAPVPKEAPAVKEAPSAAAGGTASGSVTLHGETWKVADAVAYPDGDEIHVALMSTPFDRKEAAKDGKIDSFDVMNQGMKGNASTLTVKVGKDGDVNCIDFSVGGGGGSSCGSTQQQGWKLGKRSDSSISGTLAYADGDDKVDVRFDTPVLRKVKRAGSALPAGGGEPGKALLERFAANRSGDFDKIKALTAPSDRDRMDGISDEEKKMALDFMKLSTPTGVKVTGGVVDGDTATVDFVGKGDDGAKVKGTAEARRVDGKWYVGSISTGP